MTGVLLWLAIGALLGAWVSGVSGAVLVGTVGALGAYLLLPTLAWGFGLGMAILLLFGVGCSVALGYARGGDEQRLNLRLGGLIFALMWGTLLVVGTSWSAFYASSYQRVLAIRDTTTTTPALEQMDPARVRIVTNADLARRMAESVLGENGALGSQVRVGEMTLQLVAGEWLWVGALDHSSLLRWISNDATPGYVTVSATRLDGAGVAKLVLTRGQTPLRLVYNEGAFFHQDVARRFYGAASTTGRVAPHFEIDDDGRPYWVSATFERVAGFGGQRMTGGLVMDAETGQITRCALRDCPTWIDVLHPAFVAEHQINDWGEYAEGWWNPSGRNKLAATDGVGRVIDPQGHQYYYTGIRSVNADQGTTGYMLVDTRTGEARYVRQAGVTEAVAMNAAAGAVQEKEYTAEYPTPYVVGGTWSYFLPLMDRSGWPKSYAFVAVNNAQIFAIGTTPAEALRAFRQRLVGTQGLTTDPTGATATELRGVVDRIAADIRSGQTTYLFTLSGRPEQVFAGSSVLNAALPLTQPGDSVVVGFIETGEPVIDLSRFESRRYRLKTRPVAPAAPRDTAQSVGLDSTPTR